MLLPNPPDAGAEPNPLVLLPNPPDAGAEPNPPDAGAEPNPPDAGAEPKLDGVAGVGVAVTSVDVPLVTLVAIEFLAVSLTGFVA